MVLFILDNGNTETAMGMVSKSGWMVAFMKVYGKAIWPMVKADRFMLMGMSMRENGPMIKRKGRVCTFTMMEQSTKVIGFKINSMGMVPNSGLMVATTRECTATAKNTARVNSYGLTEVTMKASLEKTL